MSQEHNKQRATLHSISLFNSVLSTTSCSWVTIKYYQRASLRQRQKKRSIELMMTFLIWRIRCVQSVTYTGGTCWSSHVTGAGETDTVSICSAPHTRLKSAGGWWRTGRGYMSQSVWWSEQILCLSAADRKVGGFHVPTRNSSEFCHVTWAWIHIWEEIDPSSLLVSAHTHTHTHTAC